MSPHIVDTSSSNHNMQSSYILNRGWIDRSTNHVPTYTEITAGPSTSKKRRTEGPDHVEEEDSDASDSSLSDDEFDEVAEHFESSYNFRYEEP